MKEYWIDHNGDKWIVPTIKGRLKSRIPSHRALREFVIVRDGNTCQICGTTNKLKLVADHIVSRRNGGSHHPDNLQCLCDSCNARKAGLIDAKGGVV
ncbi:HNH endonuclease [Acinetobacter guillouiae]|uniref:HNH endonuclease n=1 Tax=Acinetobacter guillouiae TaxID=106649 RepID=UPI003AF8FD72